MKKFIVLLIALAGMLTVDVNAQTCCASKKECKPKLCCPEQSNCCKEVKSIFSTFLDKIKVETMQQKESSPQPKPQQSALKEEKTIAATTSKIE